MRKVCCRPPLLQYVKQHGRYFFFGSPFFVAARLDSLDPAAILKLYDFCIFPFDKSQRSAHAPFLLFPSFPLPIFAKSRSPKGAPRDLAKIGRGKEGKRRKGARALRCDLSKGEI